MTESFLFGQTVLRQSIRGFRYGSSGPPILILGGVHGDETEGVFAAKSLQEIFSNRFDFSLQVTLIPEFNLDGVQANTRVNGAGVDLNRNLPTRDWNPTAFNDRYPPGPHACSEPENQALVNFLEKTQPVFVLSLHSFTKFLLNVNGDCGPEAHVIHQSTDYPIEESMGYPTPGCLGTYCGLEREMPTLTYELERGLSKKSILDIHIPAICAALKETQKRKST